MAVRIEWAYSHTPYGMADFVGMMAMRENGGDVSATHNDGIQINMRRGVWQYALFPSRTNVGGVHCMGV